ncbi:MAG: BLUF domain-containing protein [Algiphilus sp.]
MLQVIYVSAEAEPFTRNKLRDLLDVSRRNNEAAGVTGMLVYHDGTFLQVLEGEADTVNQLLQTIDADPRHHKVKLLLRQEIKARSFAGWSMGFVNASGASLQDYPGFVDFFGSGPPFDASHGDRAKQALERFRDGQWRLNRA